MISVCIATYNGEDYIRQQVQSILSQLGKDDEVIVSDDHSTDKTLQILESFHDDRIHVYEHVSYQPKKKTFIGFRKATNNFENALSHAKGEIIFLSDQDDYWMPNKLQRMVEALTNSDFVQCNCSLVDGNNKEIQSSYRTKNPFSSCFLVNLINMPFQGCCCAFKRSVLAYALPFPTDLLAHDFWIGSLACKKGKCTFIQEPLHAYRQHNYNVSPAGLGSPNPLWLRLAYRVTFLFQYSKRLYTLFKHS